MLNSFLCLHSGLFYDSIDDLKRLACGSGWNTHEDTQYWKKTLQLKYNQ